MRRSALAVLTALIALAAPSVAGANTTAILRECQDGKISGKYSQAELSDALRNIATDADEYTDCRDVIRRARLDAAGGGGDNSGGESDDAPAGAIVTGGRGSSSSANAGKTAAQILESAAPAERAAVTKARREPSVPVRIGGRTVSPDTAGLSPAGATNVLPNPLLVALVLLAAGLAAAATQTIRTRVLARRAAPA